MMVAQVVVYMHTFRLDCVLLLYDCHCATYAFVSAVGQGVYLVGAVIWVTTV